MKSATKEREIKLKASVFEEFFHAHGNALQVLISVLDSDKVPSEIQKLAVMNTYKTFKKHAEVIDVKS